MEKLQKGGTKKHRYSTVENKDIPVDAMSS